MQLDDMLKAAEKRASNFDQEEQKRKAIADEPRTEKNNSLGQQSRRAFLRELKKVVEHADVVLHVLDARDPLGSRASQVEELVLRNSSKRMVFVLNKVDLVPKEAVAAWLAFLRRHQPTVAFKCATQDGSSHLAQRHGKVEDATGNALKQTGSVGAEALVQLLKNYCRSEGGVKRTLSVGVVGYPNVGKSSLINSLKRTKCVGVSPTPGFTRSMQEVILDQNIRLLDCPGIVFDDLDSKNVLLRNCLDVDSMPDPIPAVEALLERVDSAALMQLYSIPAFDRTDARSFLALFARKKGKLLKGGVPDYTAAARAVLKDWNSGKVPFYTPVPEVAHTAGLDGEAKIVGEFSADFAAENMMEADALVLATLPEASGVDFIKVEARDTPNMCDINTMDEEDVSDNDAAGIEEEQIQVDGTGSEEEEPPILVPMEGSGIKTQSGTHQLQEEQRLNPQVNQTNKKALKALKKKLKREQKKDVPMTEDDT